MPLLPHPALHRLAALLLMLWAWATPAPASPIGAISCFCFLSTDAEVFQAPVQVKDPKFQPFNGTGSFFLQSDAATEGGVSALGRAAVDVTIGGNVLAASGVARLSTDLPAGVTAGSFASASGSIVARWTFDVLVDSLFTLDGLIDTAAVVTGGASLPTVNNVMSLLRLDVPGNLFSALTDDESFSVSGLMPAGTYRLFAESGVDVSTQVAGSASGEASYEFRLALTPQRVPEPPVVWLVTLAGALLATAGGRRRARGARGHLRQTRSGPSRTST